MIKLFSKFFSVLFSTAFIILSIQNCSAKKLNINLDERNAGSYVEIMEDIASRLDIQWKFNKSLDAFEDWMRDLSWLDADDIMICIKLPKRHYKVRDIQLLKDSFENCLVPYWVQNGAKKLSIRWN